MDSRVSRFALPKVYAVTTAPMSISAHLPRAGTPLRKQAAPTRQRISTAVLVLGTALSLGSLFGPDWALRVGVVIALLSAAASCGLAWREVYLARRRHAQDLLAVGRRHSADLRAERQHNADVLDTVSERAQRWRREVDRQQTQVAGLRVEASALRTDLSSVRRQLRRADGVIATLRETVRDRDLEIAVLRADDAELGAEVHSLPRRGQLDRADTFAAPGGDGRSVIDLRATEPAMPNFEADRRGA